MNGADLRSPFAAETMRALAIDPPAPAVPPAAPGVWSGLGGALRDFAPAALGESVRTAYRFVTSGADDTMRRQQLEADDFTAEAILRRRVELDAERSRTDAELRDFVQRFTPDPATTGAGAQVVYGLGKTLTKAIPAVIAAGPVGGAAITGALEGGAETQRLEDQGVDTATATRAGVATGVLTAVGFGLPAAGSTLARTAALAAVGGPGGFMAQQAAVSYILDSADYSQIAAQYDPFDPLGLAVSTLAAGAFGAAGMAAARRGARPAPAADPEAVAAARAVQLSEQAASSAIHAPADLDGAAKHVEALATAARQLEQGRPVDVADVAKVDGQVLAGKVAAAEIPRSTDPLTPEQRTIESRFAEQIASDYAAAVARYNEREDAKGGKVLNTDVAREVSDDYLRDRTQAAAVHEPASWLIKRLYAQKLAEPPKPGEYPIVAFTAGGTGAGKTSGVKMVPEAQQITERAQIVYDTNMNTLDSSVKKIEQALAADKKVVIVYVYREPVDALVNGALPRAMRQEKEFGSGRTVPLHEHIKTHVGAREVIEQLAARYAGDDRVRITVIDNSRGAGKATKSRLSNIPRVQYNELAPKVRAALEGEREAGKISEAVYRGFAERGGKQADAGRVREADRNVVPAVSEPGSNGSRAAAGAARQEVAGNTATVVTERGLSLPVRYKVVDARELVTSHDDALRANPAFPAELQPRDRTRAASEAQIAKIEGAINPELLAESPKAADGAPIIGADRVVESGNARTIALRRAYTSGKADSYRAWLVDNADRFGMKAADVDRIEWPVLVRETAGKYDRAEFARQANEAAQARMSAPEQAKVDAQRMPDLDRLVTNEDGTINVPQSREFIRDFFDSVVSPAELNDMIASDGRPSVAGLARIRNALFAKAYGDAELVAMLTESTDANIRNILGGLMRAAPAVAKLRDQIAAGARQPLDFSKDLATAARLFSRLRSEGTSVESFLSQGALIDSPVTPEVAALLRGLADNARSAPRIADMLQRMIGAVDALGDPRQGGMFDAPAAGVRDVAEAATGAMREEQATVATAQQSIELQAAREAVQLRPDLTVQVAEGESVPAAQLLEQAKADADADRAEAAAYQAAVSCFLRG